MGQGDFENLFLAGGRVEGGGQGSWVCARDKVKLPSKKKKKRGRWPGGQRGGWNSHLPIHQGSWLNGGGEVALLP